MDKPTDQILDDEHSQFQNSIDVSYADTSKWIMINSGVMGLALSISIGLWAIFASTFLPSAHVPFIFKFFYWLIGGWLISTSISVVVLWRNINKMGDFQYRSTTPNLEKIFAQKTKYWRLSGLNLAIGCFLIIAFFAAMMLSVQEAQQNVERPLPVEMSTTVEEAPSEIFELTPPKEEFVGDPSLENSDINQAEVDTLNN